MRPLFSRMFSAFLIVITVLGLRNVYGNNNEVSALAERTACGLPNCAVAKTREERTPISHAYTFQLRLIERSKNPKGAVQQVTCRRQYVLLGTYECHSIAADNP